MKQLMADGRTIMARYGDIRDFFDTHRIVGRQIADIRPFLIDYRVRFMDEFDDIEDAEQMLMFTAIQTDGQVCIVFEDGDSCEVEIPGEAPIILGLNTVDWSQYPVYDGSCYSLRTMFRGIVGRTVTEVRIMQTDSRMEFPSYCGIDMSEDDEGVRSIQWVLDDGTYIEFEGSVDWFCVGHYTADGGDVYIPLAELLKEMDEQSIFEMFE